MEIRNVEEIYIHYFADKSSGVTDGGGVHSKPMVFSLTQIKPENFCQEEEHFLNHQKCDELKGMQDFCQNEKTEAYLASSAASSVSISRNEVDLMGKPIDNSRVPSNGADGKGGKNKKRCEKAEATATLDIKRMMGNESKETEDRKKGKEKVKRKERVAEEKVKEKSKVGSEELMLNMESLLDLPKRRKDATTQVERGLVRRLLGKTPNVSCFQKRQKRDFYYTIFLLRRF